MISKITGCILGAAAGDAMGAATEGKSTQQIIMTFGGPVDDFRDPPRDVPARGRKAGQVTDAFSIPYMLTEEIIQNGGSITTRIASEALLRWGDSEYFEPFAGMTTRKAVIRMNENKHLNTWDQIGHLGNKLFKGHYYALSSNGAAVKAYPAALFSGGDIDTAIDNAVRITLSSHDDPYSVSGACAVAAAVAAAMNTSSVYEIVSAAMYGAEKGEETARATEGICVYPGPSVVKRLDMAIETALHYSGERNAAAEIRDRIGCGPAIAETVPAAIGIIIARKGDPAACIRDAVNIGDETSAIASIAGAVTGTMHGCSAFPQWYPEFLNKANSIDICRQAEAVLRICQD